MLTKLCSKCGRIMELGSALCPECQSKQQSRHKHYDTNVRDKRSARFYASQQWIMLRDVTLIQAGRQCQLCKQQGKLTPATEVHHIVPIRVDWSKRLAPDNCIALCHSCHMNEEKKTTHGAIKIVSTL
jgi:5-methylcytosine-specific restriction protein A